MYCSNTDGDDCTKVNSSVRLALEDVFHRAGVDVDFSAHEHSYERLFPVHDYKGVQIYDQACQDDVGCTRPTMYDAPASAVHIVTGAAGCNEDLGACINPIRKHRGNWSAFFLQAEGTYSYGRLTAHNSSLLQWEVVLAEEDRVVDDVRIVSKHHGPRTT